MWSLGFAFILLYVNSRSVSNFGTFEYWFAMIKVAAIVLFIILGASLIFGSSVEPVGFHNLTGLPGGFMPHGFSGVWMAVIMGVLLVQRHRSHRRDFGRDAQDPVQGHPGGAAHAWCLRLFLFYILALTHRRHHRALDADRAPRSSTQSPFVSVFATPASAHAAGIMNFVVLSAALSSMNTNVYLCSRMLFSLSRGGLCAAVLGSSEQERHADRGDSGLGRLHPDRRGRLDVHAAWPTTTCSASRCSAPSSCGSSSCSATSASAAATRSKICRCACRSFPCLQIVGLVLLVAFLVTMAFDREFWGISWIVGVPWLILLTIVYFVRRSKLDAAARLAVEKGGPA